MQLSYKTLIRLQLNYQDQLWKILLHLLIFFIGLLSVMYLFKYVKIFIKTKEILIFEFQLKTKAERNEIIML